MRTLVGKCFGIGNAICAVPMIKALRAMGHDVDVLVGNTPDDFGAGTILNSAPVIGGGNVYVNYAHKEYTLAVMAIPFDGRWQNGIHFRADQVLDGRTRPDPSTTGLISWKKHEIEYQMDIARELGFKGETPDCSFTDSLSSDRGDMDKIYIGVGYKKDEAGYWKVKHWGNERFAELIALLLRDRRVQIVCTGNTADFQMTMAPIAKILKSLRFQPLLTSLPTAMAHLSRCGIYVGNDTGMMHVAASMNKKVVAYFNIENAITKSRPWCEENIVFDGTKEDVTPQQLYEAVEELRHGKA